MPDVVFRVVLPVYGVLVVAAIAARRWRLVRETGQDPILIRPFRRDDTPYQYLESTLSLGSAALALDVLLNALSPELVREHLAIPALRACAPLGWLGLALVLSGLLVSSAAVRHMGASWRIGIDREKLGPLVTRGLFRRVRHPIYAGLLLAVSGMAAATAELLSVAVAAAWWLAFPSRPAWRSSFLLSVHPEEYKAYQA